MTYSDLSKHSPETQAAVEQEVRVLLRVQEPLNYLFTCLLIMLTSTNPNNVTLFSPQDSYDRAKKLLKTYSIEHKKLADALLTYETLDAKEIQMVLEGKTLDPR